MPWSCRGARFRRSSRLRNASLAWRVRRRGGAALARGGLAEASCHRRIRRQRHRLRSRGSRTSPSGGIPQRGADPCHLPRRGSPGRGPSRRRRGFASLPWTRNRNRNRHPRRLRSGFENRVETRAVRVSATARTTENRSIPSAIPPSDTRALRPTDTMPSSSTASSGGSKWHPADASSPLDTLENVNMHVAARRSSTLRDGDGASLR